MSSLQQCVWECVGEGLRLIKISFPNCCGFSGKENDLLPGTSALYTFGLIVAKKLKSGVEVGVCFLNKIFTVDVINTSRLWNPCYKERIFR